MTRIKLAVVSTITAAMILGSTLVFASAPAADADGAAADPAQQTVEWKVPSRSGAGGAGHNLKK